ncbi:hypothetical protein [Alkalimarinus coralli]|uniref:hypothetical protein n=1 Tax=Alkalimarinus coralli TaxID=2935863 RepID=UPI00202BA33F|nr:hypothetical protein [Alkalimarinus coralli]
MKWQSEHLCHAITDVSKAFFDDPYLKSGYSAYPPPGAIESVIIYTIKRVDRIAIPVCRLSILLIFSSVFQISE